MKFDDLTEESQHMVYLLKWAPTSVDACIMDTLDEAPNEVVFLRNSIDALEELKSQVDGVLDPLRRLRGREPAQSRPSRI